MAHLFEFAPIARSNLLLWWRQGSCRPGKCKRDSSGTVQPDADGRCRLKCPIPATDADGSVKAGAAVSSFCPEYPGFSAKVIKELDSQHQRQRRKLDREVRTLTTITTQTWKFCCDKNVIVLCSERVNFDQNGSNRQICKPLKNQVK